jgi:hypothetical protein
MAFLKPQYSFSPDGLNAKLYAASTSSTLQQQNKCFVDAFIQQAT